ncbi:sigma-70 family RNA polymerase sigma factor [Amycolatopsis sp. OK19-0408]|uniref:Sigma-70 family RNA polymerase sigma factor n=1 Tax=Amycolatopsis iheyensis TaxID=2945988 RepID=A0A9X2NAL3_9PSEU|nr:sigma-70 family RNA polymerase sigma factor [Amycolatopsis iheyensis]MCR6483693.1 sigma-70 family RNA polymerase sigma factor [Amycolatopsis iheyensis]
MSRIRAGERDAMTGDLAEAVEAFEAARPKLFGIAYRLLGTAADAEDVVQDTWIRWQGADRADVRNAEAFLVTTVSRLALTAAGSARARRELYVGPWLPEPVPTGAGTQVAVERGEALELAILLLLERLGPEERAVYVLREAFGYPYREIAGFLGISEELARRKGHRARGRVGRERDGRVTPAERDRLLTAFLAAARQGDLAGLQAMLAEHVVSCSDGGGVVTAARKPVVGRERVARYLARTVQIHGRDAEVEVVEANGQAVALVFRGETPLAACWVDATAAGIDRICLVVNPAKLATLRAATER